MINAVVTDIEGTTSSLAFVKEVLFPYAHNHLADFVRSHEHEAQVQALLEDTAKETGAALTTEQSIAQLLAWIDEDKKVTPLKSLQGLIWEAGYRQGDFNGHVYQDAAETLRAWQARGLALYIYSSGSVHAQQLLFAHTEYGDLTPLFSGYFDTRIGSKQEAESYASIAAQIGYPAAQIVFLSDIKAELDAARAAGFATLWLCRDSTPEPDADHHQVDSFAAIDLNRLD